VIIFILIKKEKSYISDKPLENREEY